MHLTSDKGGNAKLSDKDIVQRFATTYRSGLRSRATANIYCQTERST